MLNSLPVLDKLIVLAIVLQVGLTIGVLIWLGMHRLPLIASGRVRIRDIAVSPEGWPLQAQQIANNFNNQFQLPVLFYVAALLFLISDADLVAGVLALGFVATRFVHSAIHCTNNDVIPRFIAYTTGMSLLGLLWLWLAVRLLLGGSA